MVDGAIAILGLIYVLFIDSGQFFANPNSYIILAIAWVVVFETARNALRVLRGAPTPPLAETPYVRTALRA